MPASTTLDVASEPVENPPVVLDEVVDSENLPKYTGQCKWFSDKLGYGFLTICDGDKKGMDIFSHHSGIKPLNSNYKTLKKGEYVQFNIINGVNGLQAVNVTGINGGALMCDFVTSRKTQHPGAIGSADVSPVRTRAPRSAHDGKDDEWHQVPAKKFGGAPLGAPPSKKPLVTKYNKNKPVGARA
jgi:cold shock CspA family protein